MYTHQYRDRVILPAFFSVGGFRAEAKQRCEALGIGMAEQIAWV